MCLEFHTDSNYMTKHFVAFHSDSQGPRAHQESEGNNELLTLEKSGHRPPSASAWASRQPMTHSGAGWNGLADQASISYNPVSGPGQDCQPVTASLAWS